MSAGPSTQQAPRCRSSAQMQYVTSSAQYDTLFAVGLPLFRVVFPEPGEYVPQSLKVIQVDLDSWELGKPE